MVACVHLATSHAFQDTAELRLTYQSRTLFHDWTYPNTPYFTNVLSGYISGDGLHAFRENNTCLNGEKMKVRQMKEDGLVCQFVETCSVALINGFRKDGRPHTDDFERSQNRHITRCTENIRIYVMCRLFYFSGVKQGIWIKRSQNLFLCCLVLTRVIQTCSHKKSLFKV